jgi:hypothetical protein
MADTREPLHVLHIGKTGGTALNHALLEHADGAHYCFVFGGHELRVADVPAGERLMFVLRDPLTRFVSSFNSRLREGRPRYHYPWRDEERAAFAVFETPDQLGAALSSSDRKLRKRAEGAMRGIGHLNTGYSFWFGGEADFRGRLADVFFIAFQEQLDDDFELLKARVGLPAEARLPQDPAVAHRSPDDVSVELGDDARANLTRWYADDLAFVELCRRLAPDVNAAQGLSASRAV